MKLVDTIENKDERTSQELARLTLYTPKSADLTSARQILVRKGQHLDVDEILARSLPNPRAFAAPGR